MDRLSHYELVEQLGAGGMGVVYKARDLRLGRFVAIKLLAPGTASDPERRRRLEKEAKAASALDHPNVLTVHEIGREGDVDFIVTEYVPGTTLARLIPRGGLPPREALRYAVQIAGALVAAHAAGVVHRDLKPANVMVNEAGLVKVLDFGLAKLLDPGPAAEGEETQALVSREGAVVGTCAYMSPEQAQGRPVDARTDVFSFGALLYEMVTGRKAFARDSVSATLAAVLSEEPEPARDVSGRVPPELERVVQRCLRKEPARRFQSMADLAVALEELREEAETSRAPRVARTGSRRRALAGLAAGLLIAAAGLVLARRRPDAPEPTRPVPLTSFSGRIRHPALSPDGNQVAFVWDGEARDAFDLYVKLVGPGAPIRLTNDPAVESSPAWSPDGRQIAFVRSVEPGRSVLAVIPALGGAERTVAEAWGFGPGICWSPDGQAILAPMRDQARAWSRIGRVSVTTGAIRPLTSPPELPAREFDAWPALSPDGRTLAFVRGRSTSSKDAWLLPLTAGLDPAGEPVRLTSDWRPYAQPAWSPDGKRIVVSVGGDPWSMVPALLVVPASAAPGEKARLLPGGDGGEYPSFSRMGSLVFTRSLRDVNIWRLPLEGGRPGRPAPLVASTRIDSDPRFSPDGRRITFSSDRVATSSQGWACEADGSHPVQLTSMDAAITSGGRLSPDGKRYVFLSTPDGNSDVFLATLDGRPPQRLAPSPQHDTAPSWSRDGSWVYFASNREDGYQVWKVRPDPGAVPVRVTRGGGVAALESADGGTIFYAKYLPSGGTAVWKVPAAGGEEAEVVPSIKAWGDFDVTATGLYYVTPGPGKGQLRLRRLSDGSDTLLLALERRPAFGVAAAPDDSCVLYTSYDLDSTELMLVERFR